MSRARAGSVPGQQRSAGGAAPAATGAAAARRRSTDRRVLPPQPPDFTGYWALAKHEQMDEFLKAAGFPWVVRKAALKFGGSAVDVCSHAGSLLTVTSLNAKGSWTRSYDVDREVVQGNAEGHALQDHQLVGG